MLKNLIADLRNVRKTEAVLPMSDDADRAASYPAPYPDGWYKLADSADLARGQVLPKEGLGQRWVVFRSDVDGQIGVLDANCPHQGAHLAAGTVEDGCLECPFHKWRFAVDGKVTDVPYASGHPASLRAKSWPVCELHGLVLVYYSAARARGVEVDPPYALDPIAGLSDMAYRGAYDYPRPVRMHLVEFAENSADFQHFQPLHGRMHIPWTPWRVPLMGVRHSPTWELDPERPHVSYFHDDAILEFNGRALPSSGARASITFLGPGGLTVFQIAIPKLGSVILFHTHLPKAPMAQEVQFRWYADKKMPRLLVSYVVGSWISQWKNDISIWENKYYKARPMLVPGDGPVLRMRRWFKQFYPAESAPAPVTSLPLMTI